MAGIVGGSPFAAAMGVGAITDALCRLWSRLRVHEWPTRVRGGGPSSYIGAKYKYATFQSDKDHIF